MVGKYRIECGLPAAMPLTPVATKHRCKPAHILKIMSQNFLEAGHRIWKKTAKQTLNELHSYKQSLAKLANAVAMKYKGAPTSVDGLGATVALGAPRIEKYMSTLSRWLASRVQVR